ncbi:MAG TPA: PAS domain-containing protein [Terracidiphilus sp.]|nr:PAS domain-containing protein [Terracidiphilus sp.]
MNLPSASAIEQWPWPIRALLGCVLACAAVGITYAIQPLRAFPLLLAFPTVILSAWFLGMMGGLCSALTDVLLVDQFLTKSQFRFSIGDAREEARLALFLLISLLMGWSIRRLAHQRSMLSLMELRERLNRANIERRLAEERARAVEELRDRDEMLQLALRANGMGLWVWDLQTNVFHRSDEMLRMVGRDPGSISSKPEEWLTFIHPDDVKGVMEAMHKTRDVGVDYHKQYRVVRPDGSVHWLESQGKCQRDSEGHITRIVGVIADATQRKRAEEAMVRAEKLAVAGRLAASVAHEINNPLEAVANLLYLMTMTDTVEECQDRANQALDELMRVSMIARQTLKFHRQEGSPKSILLSELVESVIAMFRAKLVASQIDVHVQTLRELRISCMPSEAQQIFANLVSNAIEAMPRGGILRIRLRASRDWRDRSKVGMRITFADSGTGMSRETMRRIDEPFFTTKTETGTGLGMWVVAQLLERHHGSISVWSSQRNGRSGTTFSIFVPAGSQSSLKERAVPATTSTDPARLK